MLKKVLSAVLCILMLVSVFSVSVSAKGLIGKDSSSVFDVLSNTGIGAESGEKLSFEGFLTDMGTVARDFFFAGIFSVLGAVFLSIFLPVIPILLLNG